MNDLAVARRILIEDRGLTPEQADAALAGDPRFTARLPIAEKRAELEAQAEAERFVNSEEGRRALATKLRAEQIAEEEKYQDALVLVAHEYGHQIGDPGELDRADLYRLAYGEGPPTDAELAVDVEANLAAAERTRPEWKPQAPPDSPYVESLKTQEGDAA